METARLTAQGRAGLIPTSGCRRRLWTREREAWVFSPLFAPILMVSHLGQKVHGWAWEMAQAPATPGSRQFTIQKALGTFPTFLSSRKHGAGDIQLSWGGESGMEWEMEGICCRSPPNLCPEWKGRGEVRFYFTHILHRVLYLAFVIRLYIWTTYCKDPIHPFL